VAPPIEVSDGNLYGTTVGTDDLSTIYKYTLRGGVYSTIYTFTAGYGEAVQGQLTEASDANLYGAAPLGGADFCGTLFKVSQTGTLVWSYDFPCGSGGQSPYSLTQASNGNLYGVTSSGGAELNCGTIFQAGPTGEVSILYAFPSYAGGCNPQTALTVGTARQQTLRRCWVWGSTQ